MVKARIFWLHEPIEPKGWWWGLGVSDTRSVETIYRERRYVPIEQSEALGMAQEWNKALQSRGYFCAIGEMRVTPLEFLAYMERSQRLALVEVS